MKAAWPRGGYDRVKRPKLKRSLRAGALRILQVKVFIVMAMRKKPRSQQLTREERALLALGRAAERFVAVDREARALRAKRNQLGQMLWYNHPNDDDVACFDVQVTIEEEDGEIWTQRQPIENWCVVCRIYAEAHDRAVEAYHDRRSARQALTAAYRRLLRIRQEEQTTE